MAGTDPDYPSFDNWVFENNHVYDNNLPNPAPAGTFQYALQSGVGLLLVGISEHTIKENVFEKNGWAGVRKCQNILLSLLDCVVDSSLFLYLTFPGHCSRVLHRRTIGFSK
jgi:hypothetical protein